MIPKPTKKQIKHYLKVWDGLESYTLQESSLHKLFTKTYPKNTDIDDVLIKVCSLNDFYSTNIFSPFNVAKHIVNLDIDSSLDRNDIDIVNKIARVNMPGGKLINFYSFATKYCSHHDPEMYPIYDSYVQRVLMYFKKQDKFANFKSIDLKDFSQFKSIIEQFREFYGLNDFSLKDIDRYLWQFGKEYFPKKY